MYQLDDLDPTGWALPQRPDMSVVVVLGGQITHQTVAMLPAQLLRLAKTAATQPTLVDLDHVYLADSASIDALAAALRTAGLDELPLRIVRSRPAMREAFRIAGLDSLHD